MSKGLIPLEYMSRPERIGEILKRVFVDLEKIYGGAVPPDLAGSPDPLDPPILKKKENGEDPQGGLKRRIMNERRT